MLKNLIFDFDGVIRGYLSDRRQALEMAIKEAGEDNKSEQLISEILLTIEKFDRAFPSKPMRWIVQRSFKKYKLSSKVMNLYFEYLYHVIKLNDSFLRTLPKLKSWKLFIFSSSSSDFILETLRQNGIDQDIQVFSTLDYGKAKPCLNLLERFLSEQNLNPIETIYIGNDFVEDILPSKILGLKVILFNNYADSFCSSFKQLLDILNKNG